MVPLTEGNMGTRLGGGRMDGLGYITVGFIYSSSTRRAPWLYSDACLRHKPVIVEHTVGMGHPDLFVKI